MKRAISAVLMMLVLGAMIMSCTDVDPGQVGVRAWKRGERRGEIEILEVGRHSLSIKADDWFYPTTKKNYVWTADKAEGSPNDESMTFMIEGLEITVDVGIEFKVLKESVANIFSEYRQTLGEITDGPMRNFVRDSINDEAGVFTSMEQFISNNSINAVIDSVEVATGEYFLPRGIEVSKIYLVNAPVYPASVIQSIEAKIQATQDALKVQNEVVEETAKAEKAAILADAEAYRMTAIAAAEATSLLSTATAEAEANRLRQTSYSDQVLRAMWIDKWDGVLPSTVTSESADFMMGTR